MARGAVEALAARRDLDPKQRWQQIRALKAAAYRDAASEAGLPLSWTREGITVRVTACGVGADDSLVCDVEAERAGQRLRLDTPFVYHNPPLNTVTAEGDLVPDVIAALKEILFDTVKLFA